MAYLKPPWFVRSVVNKVAMSLGVGGSVTLAVTGRRSRQERTIPLVPVEHEDATYLVSARGETAWVQNLRAAGTCELRRRGRSPERYTAEEVPVEEREPIIGRYRAKAGRSVQPLWRKLPDPGDHPTFKLTPA
jgi:deazaflavin-dependent oxidoreductase (nitroreductase family)